MAEKREKRRAESLKGEITERMHPPPDEADAHEASALATLVALLDSEDERIRLEAAQAILNRQRVAKKKPGVAGVVKKIVKKV